MASQSNTFSGIGQTIAETYKHLVDKMCNAIASNNLWVIRKCFEAVEDEMTPLHVQLLGGDHSVEDKIQYLQSLQRSIDDAYIKLFFDLEQSENNARSGPTGSHAAGSIICAEEISLIHSPAYWQRKLVERQQRERDMFEAFDREIARRKAAEREAAELEAARREVARREAAELEAARREAAEIEAIERRLDRTRIRRRA